MTSRIVLVLLILAVGGYPSVGETYPLDCLPDRVAVWQAAEPDPGSRFGAAFLPGLVLGPPGDSSPLVGSVSVASLGFGGSVTLTFDGMTIEDRPGADFIVFENAFFRGLVPANEEDDYLIFAEPGFVEVSVDGETWVAFEHDATALSDAAGQGGADDIDRELHLRLLGLAGITPTLTGDWTLPDDPADFDAGGQGGVSGAGGDAFDLADVGLTGVRWIRISDSDSEIGFGGNAEGFEMDALVVIHGEPDPPTGLDTDGDRVADADELGLYGTDPAIADSDQDGVDDGREIAGCSDPSSGAGTGPWLHREPRIWLSGGACTEVAWTFMGSNLAYDLVRGDLDDLAKTRTAVDLGPLTCLADDSTAPALGACDTALPAIGEALFYLVQVDGEDHLGHGTAFLPREGLACP